MQTQRAKTFFCWSFVERGASAGASESDSNDFDAQIRSNKMIK